MYHHTTVLHRIITLLTLMTSVSLPLASFDDSDLMMETSAQRIAHDYQEFITQDECALEIRTALRSKNAPEQEAYINNLCMQQLQKINTITDLTIPAIISTAHTLLVLIIVCTEYINSLSEQDIQRYIAKSKTYLDQVNLDELATLSDVESARKYAWDAYEQLGMIGGLMCTYIGMKSTKHDVFKNSPLRRLLIEAGLKKEKELTVDHRVQLATLGNIFKIALLRLQSTLREKIGTNAV